jgi:hypothetical protein
MVLPALMSTAELLQSYPALKQTRFQRPLHLGIPGAQAGAILLFACGGLVCVARWPDGWYPLLWLSPLLILISVQVLLREGSVLQELERGEWNAVILPALAALVCGFFWELWGTTTAIQNGLTAYLTFKDSTSSKCLCLATSAISRLVSNAELWRTA